MLVMSAYVSEVRNLGSSASSSLEARHEVEAGTKQKKQTLNFQLAARRRQVLLLCMNFEQPKELPEAEEGFGVSGLEAMGRA